MTRDAFDALSLFQALPGRYLAYADTEGFPIVAVNDAYLAALGRRRDALLGRQVSEAFSADHGRRAALERARSGGEHTVEAEGPWRPVISRAGPYLLERLDPAASEGDVDRLGAAYSQLSRAGARLNEMVEASAAISAAMASAPESAATAVIHTIVQYARVLCDSELAAAGLGTDPAKPFESWSFSGLDSRVAGAMGVTPRPVAMLARGEGDTRTVVINDPQVLSHVPVKPHGRLSSFVSVPIRYRERVMGSLFLANAQPGSQLTEDGIRMARSLAERAGFTLEVARLFRAETAQRAWLEAVVQQMPEAVMLMDASGHVTAENQALIALRGAGAGAPLELLETNGAPLAPADAPITRALQRGETTLGRELMVRNAKGQLVPVMLSAAPVRMPSGELAGATMVLEDMSAIKALEQLREGWSALVAHDLQQPINAIGLRLDLLVRGGLTEKQLGEVAQIRAATKRLSRMTRDLLDASQLQSNRLRVAPETLELGPFLRQVVDGMPELSQRTKVATPETEVRVNADAQRLEQVLGNLLGNAMKYGSSQEEIRVDLSTRDGRAEVAITNRGPGIPADELPFLFERYFRSRAAQMGAKKGSGLGLYIAKGLVEAHGGTLSVTSVEGATTTFVVSLPVSSPPAL